MSAIQGYATVDLRQILQRQSTAASGARASGSGPEARLDSVLSETKLSDADRASLKAELKTALDEVFSSGSFPPDATEVESATKAVFSKYGLDADALAERLRPPSTDKAFAGGGPPPMMPGMGPGGMHGCANDSSQSDSSDDSDSSETSDVIQNLLTAMQEFLNQMSESKDSAQQTTDYLIAGMVGFNAQA